MGRRRIAIEKIENKDKKAVTFSKRRQGLFKKAATACDMYGSQIAIIVFSPAGKPYAFGHSSVDSVIDRFLASNPNPNPNPNSSSGPTTDIIEDRNCGGKRRSRDIDQVVVMERETKKRKLMMTNTTSQEEKEGFFWDHQNLDSEQNLKKGIEELEAAQSREETATAACSCSDLLLSPPPPDVELHEILNGNFDYENHEEENVNQEYSWSELLRICNNFEDDNREEENMNQEWLDELLRI